MVCVVFRTYCVLGRFCEFGVVGHLCSRDYASCAIAACMFVVAIDEGCWGFYLFGGPFVCSFFCGYILLLVVVICVLGIYFMCWWLLLVSRLVDGYFSMVTCLWYDLRLRFVGFYWMVRLFAVLLSGHIVGF